MADPAAILAVRRPAVRRPSGRGRTAPYVVGTVVAAIGLVLVAFWGAALLVGERADGFGVASIVGLVVGLALRSWGRSGAPDQRHGEPTRREALAALLVAWALVPGIGALPYLGVLGPLDAYFESMSGFTTTGATMLTDFSVVGPVLFMWRAFTQWIGGIGIIVLFVGLFPQLAIAGRQLFFAEAPGPTEERLTPRLRYTAFALLGVYAALTAICAGAYAIVGMTGYDAVAHALTTMSAGGFSPHDRSFEVFAPALMWVAIVFMVFAGSNFALLYRGFAGRAGSILRDVELRAYLGVAIVTSVALAAVLASGPDAYPVADAWRHAAFQALSILTSTGYASADFGLWSERSQALLLVVAFIGGSAGSAAGGVKVARWVILVQHTSREVRRSLHPRAVLPVRMGARVVPEDVLRSVAAFITLYVTLFAATTVVLVLLGSDFVTAFSAAIACLGNIGPGLGAVGPMENFAGLHPIAKGLLTFCMYAGRLEVVTVFVLLTRGWWRRARLERGFE
jgi:trk system potassium uptake protein